RETLDILAELGIRFTILAPRQAGRFRKIGDEEWQEVRDGRIDTGRAYLQRLPSGRSLSLFFYHAHISPAVSNERLLIPGETLAARLLGAFAEGREGPQPVNIASDGEIYGHHHRYGDMALAYALHTIEHSGRAQLTNYGQFLERFPPAFEMEIVENSSGSCPH